MGGFYSFRLIDWQCGGRQVCKSFTDMSLCRIRDKSKNDRRMVKYGNIIGFKILNTFLKESKWSSAFIITFWKAYKCSFSIFTFVNRWSWFIEQSIKKLKIYSIFYFARPKWVTADVGHLNNLNGLSWPSYLTKNWFRWEKLDYVKFVNSKFQVSI